MDGNTIDFFYSNVVYILFLAGVQTDNEIQYKIVGTILVSLICPESSRQCSVYYIA